MPEHAGRAQNMKKKIYAIGDIHGELALLKDAISRIEKDGGPSARVVFLGDYIDRGPDSRGVIEYLVDGLADGKKWTCLLGNHDQLFCLFMEDCEAQMTLDYHWLHDRLGGKETLKGYGIDIDNNDTLQNIHTRTCAAVPDAHIEFLESLPNFYQQDGLFFAHAGIRPGIPLERQSQQDLLWIRNEFLEDTRPHPMLVVHGHTPVAKPLHYGNRVNLDTGCGYGNQLTAAVFEGTDCWVLSDNGRKPLVPLF